MKTIKYLIIGILVAFCFLSKGQNMLQEHYKNTPDGEHKSYYKSGELYLIVVIENGYLIKNEEYYKNGQLKITNGLKNGMFNGFSYYYNESGNILSKVGYINDTVIYQEFNKYYKNQKLKESKIWDIEKFQLTPIKYSISQLTWPNQKNYLRVAEVHGIHRKYDKIGNLISEKQYLDGKEYTQ